MDIISNFKTSVHMLTMYIQSTYKDFYYTLLVDVAINTLQGY